MPLEKEFTDAREPGDIARIISSYAAKLPADDVKVVAGGDLAWIRVEGGRELMNFAVPFAELTRR